MNIICTALTLLLTIISFFIKKDNEKNKDTEEVYFRNKWAKWSLLFTTLISGSLLTKTEDFEKGFQLSNKWTILYACLTIVSVVLFAIGMKKKYEEYAITYFVNDEVYETVKYRFDEEVEDIDTPKEDGKVFSGWNKQLPEKMPKYNIELRGFLK